MTAEELLSRLKDIVEIERQPKLLVATMTKSGEKEIMECQIALSDDGVGQYVLLECYK